MTREDFKHIFRMFWGAFVDWLWYAGIPAITVMSFGLLFVALWRYIT